MQFSADNIDVNMCTHLVYSFAGLNNVTNRIGSLDPELDFSPEESEIMESGETVYGRLSKQDIFIDKEKYLTQIFHFSLSL